MWNLNPTQDKRKLVRNRLSKFDGLSTGCSSLLKAANSCSGFCPHFVIEILIGSEWVCYFKIVLFQQFILKILFNTALLPPLARFMINFYWLNHFSAAVFSWSEEILTELRSSSFSGIVEKVDHLSQESSKRDWKLVNFVWYYFFNCPHTSKL